MLYVFHGYPTMCAMFFIDGWSEEWKIDLLSTWQPKQVKGKAQIGRPFFLCTPTKCTYKCSLPFPFSLPSSNFSLPTWLYSYLSLCGNLCGCFIARQVYILIIAYAELYNLGRQRIKNKTNIPQQGELSTVEITMAIKKQFCNYKIALAIKRK